VKPQKSLISAKKDRDFDELRIGERLRRSEGWPNSRRWTSATREPSKACRKFRASLYDQHPSAGRPCSRHLCNDFLEGKPTQIRSAPTQQLSAEPLRRDSLGWAGLLPFGSLAKLSHRKDRGNAFLWNRGAANSPGECGKMQVVQWINVETTAQTRTNLNIGSDGDLASFPTSCGGPATAAALALWHLNEALIQENLNKTQPKESRAPVPAFVRFPLFMPAGP
jgi:hypothetical protein